MEKVFSPYFFPSVNPNHTDTSQEARLTALPPIPLGSWCSQLPPGITVCLYLFSSRFRGDNTGICQAISYTKKWRGVPSVAPWDWGHLGSTGTQIQSLAQHSKLRMGRCRRSSLGHWPGNSMCCRAAKKERNEDKVSINLQTHGFAEYRFLIKVYWILSFQNTGRIVFDPFVSWIHLAETNLKQNGELWNASWLGRIQILFLHSKLWQHKTHSFLENRHLPYQQCNSSRATVWLIITLRFSSTLFKVLSLYGEQ